jgi:hypothetical protein
MWHLCHIHILMDGYKSRGTELPCIHNYLSHETQNGRSNVERYCLFLFVAPDHARQTVLYHHSAPGMASRRESRSAVTGAHTLQEFENRKDQRSNCDDMFLLNLRHPEQCGETSRHPMIASLGTLMFVYSIVYA